MALLASLVDTVNSPNIVVLGHVHFNHTLRQRAQKKAVGGVLGQQAAGDNLHLPALDNNSQQTESPCLHFASEEKQRFHTLNAD